MMSVVVDMLAAFVVYFEMALTLLGNSGIVVYPGWQCIDLIVLAQYIVAVICLGNSGIVANPGWRTEASVLSEPIVLESPFPRQCTSRTLQVFL